MSSKIAPGSLDFLLGRSVRAACPLVQISTSTAYLLEAVGGWAAYAPATEALLLTLHRNRAIPV